MVDALIEEAVKVARAKAAHPAEDGMAGSGEES
jgi:hypothetical protein